MDVDQTPGTPVEPLSSEDGTRAKRPRRFGTGIVLGLGIGVLTVIIIMAIAALLVYLSFVRPLTDPAWDGPSGEIETVQLEGSWLTMTDAQHGTVIGWSIGGMGSGSDMPSGAFAEFDLSMPTEQDGVKALVSVPILITRDTKLLMAGEAWNPAGTGTQTPLDAVFGDSNMDVGYDYLDMRKLTVAFRREGDNLIAESIDASASQEEAPIFWMGGF